MPRAHILEIWDPGTTADPMQAHVRVLLNAVNQFRAGRCKEDDVYVWWGHSNQERAHPASALVDRVRSLPLETSRNDPEPETHLYLTDFSSLYVGHLGSIASDDVRTRRDDKVPSLYRQKGLDCALWYKLWDLRRLVDRDPVATSRELNKLHSLDEGHRPVSARTGIPVVPYIVNTVDSSRHFDPFERSHFIENHYWVEFDSRRQGIGAVERDLLQNRFGERAWSAYGPLGRSFIATGEMLWRNHASDVRFDFSMVLLEFCKALEVRCNGLLREVLSKAPSVIRATNIDGVSVDIDKRPLDLTELGRFIGDDKERTSYLRTKLRNGPWFVGQLPSILKDLAKHRNDAAHGSEVEWDDVARWRAHLVGVGCQGHLVELGHTEPLTH